MNPELQSTIYFLILHFLCVSTLCGLYVSMRGFRAHSKRQISKRLKLVYVSSLAVVVSDAVWQLLSYLDCQIVFLNYFVNISYFFFSSVGVMFWMCYCLEIIEAPVVKSRKKMFFITLPSAVYSAMAILSPWTKWIFTLNGSEYIRGKYFFIDPAVKLGYVVCAMAVVLIFGLKEEKPYKKNRDFLLLLFGIPTIIGGIFQALTGYDFNCISLTIGLMTLYIYGVTNSDKHDGDILYSFARAYDALFMVNMDEHTIKTIRLSDSYAEEIDRSEEEIESYEVKTIDRIANSVLPEDAELVAEKFRIEYVAERLEESPVYSVSYRIRTLSNEVIYHQATFYKMLARGGMNAFLLCVKKVNVDELITQRMMEIEERNIRLNKLNEDILSMAAEIVEARDSESGQHISRVKDYSRVLAAKIMKCYPEFGLTPEKVNLIASASALHDIGKIMVPDAILLKPGRLTDEEYAVMKKHSEDGVKVLDKLNVDLSKDYLECAKEICLWHHERYDGSGYPDGLIGDEIPISAQIVAVADCYDALTSDRVYKAAIPHEDAMNMILDGECGDFSVKILKCLADSADSFKAVNISRR